MNRLIAIGAASFAGMGVVSFLKPDVVTSVVGVAAPHADARTELRAVYGGMPLALAATLAAAPSSGTVIGVATAGMAAGRAGSSYFEGGLSPKMKGFMALEIALAGALVLGARQHRKALTA
ncbi:DUF4345 family protein [Nocardioides panacisoli]|uniref:DUF4345 family protein n=1 Tax=Nocardioides panacisoli TaxID=627624 RepID=A0ABP7I013_9ACTN